MSEETNLVNYFLWTIIEGDLDIIYEHKKWRRKRERGSARKPYCDRLPCLLCSYMSRSNPLIFQSDGHAGLVVLDACVPQLGQVYPHEGTHQLLPV